MAADTVGVGAEQGWLGQDEGEMSEQKCSKIGGQVSLHLQVLFVISKQH